MANWYDYLNPVYDVGQLINHTQVQGQPGAENGAGPRGRAVDPSKLVKDPVTGYYFDPTTGTSYMDANGITPITNPDVAQQVAKNFQTAQQFLGNLQGVQGREQSLEGKLTTAMNGGPSVAAAQLQQGFGTEAAKQMALASGANGPTSALANMSAARNIGAADIATNQSAALTRAQEEEAARQQLSTLLQSEAGTNLQGAAHFATTAEGGEEQQQGMQQKGQQYNQDFYTKLLGAASKGGSGATAPQFG